MSTLTPNTVSSGNIIYAADHNELGSRVAAVVNGGLDNANINASAAIATSKLADDAGITSGKIASGAVTASKLSTGAATNFVNTTETTTSTSYVALATAQAVTVTIGANGLALVMISHGGWNNGADAQTLMSYAVSGANTIAAGTYETNHRQTTANAAVRAGTHHLLTGLTPGSTTFTAQFRVTSGTGSFYAREITVIPL